MGVNGAVLTGDLFNLFVFVEVMLAASYGLILHGSGEQRVRAGLHYIAINLAASMLFLIGVSMIYGTAGTLNMADLAGRIPTLSAEVRPLFEVACALLAVAFLIKASAWPLGFWLPRTYAAASAPVSAILAIMSKVGVYALIRLSLLLFGPAGGDSAGFGQDALLVAGLATIAFGTAGALGAKALNHAIGYSIMISSGTVLAALGLDDARALAGALFYMVGSTLAAGALYLLAEILARDDLEEGGDASEQVFADEYQDPFDQETLEDAVAIPLTLAVLGGAFLACTLTLAGLPPLAGFIGKLAIFIGALSADGGGPGPAGWTTVGLLTLSSLGVLICLARFGVAELWVPAEEPAPMVRPVEFAALAGLLGAVLLLSVFGGPVMDYMDSTAAGLDQPGDYVSAVLGAEIK
jgi:multicomponent K+:H+ antiporter subunit D